MSCVSFVAVYEGLQSEASATSVQLESLGWSTMVADSMLQCIFRYVTKIFSANGTANVQLGADPGGNEEHRAASGSRTFASEQQREIYVGFGHCPPSKQPSSSVQVPARPWDCALAERVDCQRAAVGKVDLRSTTT